MITYWADPLLPQESLQVDDKHRSDPPMRPNATACHLAELAELRSVSSSPELVGLVTRISN